MNLEEIFDILLDALKDSLLVFAFILVLNIVLSFFETKIASLLKKRSRLSPLFGSLFGLVPQCGTSVMGADLYIKRSISLGTLIAIFLSCSDEAIPLLISSNKAIYVIPLLLIKLVYGFLIGFLVDLVLRKQKLSEEVIIEEHCHDSVIKKHPKLHTHLVHPLIHSFELFLYVLLINLVFGYLVGFIGEENFTNFMLMNKYVSPLLTSVIGLIPNCVSSIIMSSLFISNSLSFGALLTGLCMNAGMGLVVLLKTKGQAKNLLIIILTMLVASILIGYITCFIIGF